ncbi:uncharacterized protein LOC141631445 [Silene latifolia]|uniref:uncharacterized protein LOC141631445 n=1 Tax=Silene latifolia TaxID=37657 RepID=UPI003D76BD1B
MYEYLEKFKQLCASYRYHGYSDQDLIIYFCGGLNQDDCRMIHSACRGNIENKNPDDAWEVIAELAETSRQFERRPSRRGVNAMGVSPGLEEKVDNIDSTLCDMLSGRQMVSICSICCTEGHSSDLCPYVQGSGPEEVNGVRESTPNNRKWNPFSKTYKEGFKAHPNFYWGNSQAGEQAPPSSSMCTEEMIRALTLSVTQDRAENKQNFKNLENQVSHLATAINRLKVRDSNVIPSQTVVNPKNVSAVSLRNGRQLVEAEKVKKKDKELVIQGIEEEIVIKEREEASIIKEKKQIPSFILVVEPEVPFPDALKRTHHFEQVIRALFTIPCTTGNTKIQKAMLDLGASINVMPYSLYKSMKLGPLHATSVVIQLANRSNVYPKGIVEDVLVLVDNLIFPADFYVLDMEHDKNAAPILLGRPFLKTASTKIDVSSRSMTIDRLCSLTSTML